MDGFSGIAWICADGMGTGKVPRFNSPRAIVVIGGFFCATLLILFVLPSVYAQVRRLKANKSVQKLCPLWAVSALRVVRSTIYSAYGNSEHTGLLLG